MGSRARAAFRGAAAWGAALLLGPGAACGRFGYERLVVEREEPPDAGGTAVVDSGAPSCNACEDGGMPPAMTCSDGVLNQDETALDCGGVCSACDAGPTATCSDGVLNQDETAVDCGGACAPCIPTACSMVVADSVADFSNVQGQAGWHYGYYEEPNFASAAFIPMPAYRFEASVGEEGWFAGPPVWTWIGRSREHPNGRTTSAPSTPIEQHAVRRWVSTTSETLFVTGSIRSTSAVSSGVVGRISVADDVVWELLVPAQDTGAHPFNTLVSVEPGDVVNFVLDPHQSSDRADDTEFVVQLCR